jgi:hypothetical protein
MYNSFASIAQSVEKTIIPVLKWCRTNPRLAAKGVYMAGFASLGSRHPDSQQVLMGGVMGSQGWPRPFVHA